VNWSRRRPDPRHGTSRRGIAALLGVALAVTATAGPAAASGDAAPGDTPAPASSMVIPPPNGTELQIESALYELMVPALMVAADTQVRTLMRNAVGRQFDGDTNALWSTVIQEAEESQVVDPNAPEWVALKNEVAQFGNINGFAYDPQVYIPNFGEGALPSSTVEMAVAPADELAASATGYWMDANGQFHTTAPIDEAYVATHEVWVLSVNERIIVGGPPVAVQPASGPTGAAAKAGPAGREEAARGERAGARGDLAAALACNTTGLRNNNGEEYLLKWRVPDKSNFGGLFEGKREMKLVVIGTGGTIIKTYYFPKVKRKNIDEWQNSELFLTTWDTAVWGSAMAYQWYELDGGGTTTSTITVPVQGGGSISTSVTNQARDDDGGNTAVLFSESTAIEYTTGRVNFYTCTKGGDGGTGNDNFACGAIASASSTYPGYSPARATDCNPDTRLGGAYSWSNNNNTYPPSNPQWLQADLGVNKTFRRVVVYTSQGYPIRDFDVQVWNGVTFVTVQPVVRANTQLSVTVTFPARTARLIRILGRSGPTHQLNHVRVNELEVYAV
jgi:hypothetical protein